MVKYITEVIKVFRVWNKLTPLWYKEDMRLDEVYIYCKPFTHAHPLLPPLTPPPPPPSLDILISIKLPCPSTCGALNKEWVMTRVHGNHNQLQP